MSIECEHGSCERIAYMVKTDASGNVLHKTPEEDSGTNPMHRNVAAEIHELAMKRMQGTGAKDYVAAINDVLRKHSQLRAAYEHYVSGRPATTEAYKTKPRAGEQYGNLSDIITLKTKEYMARIGETDFRKAARFVIQNDPELGRRYVAQCCVTNVQMEHGE